jgi:hypothetical protein
VIGQDGVNITVLYRDLEWSFVQALITISLLNGVDMVKVRVFLYLSLPSIVYWWCIQRGAFFFVH